MILVIIIFIIIYLYTSTRVINFDNNATTEPNFICKIKMFRAYSLGNPSAYYANGALDKVNELKELILNILGKSEHICIICGSASEANNLLLKSYKSYCSPYEHKTSIMCCNTLNWNKLNTLHRGDLYSMMYVNNESGNIFPVAEIALECKNRGILFHTDASQYFGKSVNPIDDFKNIDFITISPHKMYGPQGIGILVIPRDAHIIPQIMGTQNGGLRGGTENMSAICGTIYAIHNTLSNRLNKNLKLEYLTERFKQMLLKYRCLTTSDTYLKKNTVMFINIPDTKKSINTVLVSFINKYDTTRFCNVKFRKELTLRGINISIGSACGTSVQGPSHVLTAMNLPFIIRCGVIRFSFGDYNTMADINEFEARCSDLLK